ncbi:MAG TPA: hypothetical protein VKV73_14270 [Chloroflexota bacterium]|nr:hypothetical protein [Chloroflexota bacterium]
MNTADQVVHQFENGRQWIRASVSQYRGDDLEAAVVALRKAQA